MKATPRGRLRRVTVDLTPMLPGAANGGVKLVARALVRELGRLAPDIEFTLLTAPASHDDCADLEAPNIRRECVEYETAPNTPKNVALSTVRLAARVVVNRMLPADARGQAKDRIWALLKERKRSTVTRKLRPDLIFCPFTAPYFFDPDVPLVATVNDVQYLDLPEFFADAVRRDRDDNFLKACRQADRIICISEFVRQRVLTASGLSPDRVQTIHLTVLRSVQPDRRAMAHHILHRLGLGSNRFLYYPANVWPHKNHRALVRALSMHLQCWPQSRLALVCSGAPSVAAEELVGFAREHLPPGAFAFAGFVADDEFSALLQSSRALIYPSLYEGFGLPVLEAMASDRPVLCSNNTSLPEVAGGAALLFDARDPAAIAEAIRQLEAEPDLETVLIQRGRERVASFGTVSGMAASYLAAFEAVASGRAAA